MMTIWVFVIVATLIVMVTFYFIGDTIVKIYRNETYYRNGNKKQIKAPMLYDFRIIVAYLVGWAFLINTATKKLEPMKNGSMDFYGDVHTAFVVVFTTSMLLMLDLMSSGPPSNLNDVLFKKFRFRSVGILVGTIGTFLVHPFAIIYFAVLALNA